MTTPKFIQIATSGHASGGNFLGHGSGHCHLFGLTADGDVYEWDSVFDETATALSYGTSRYKMQWVKLESKEFDKFPEKEKK